MGCGSEYREKTGAFQDTVFQKHTLIHGMLQRGGESIWFSTKMNNQANSVVDGGGLPGQPEQLGSTNVRDCGPSCRIAGNVYICDIDIIGPH